MLLLAYANASTVLIFAHTPLALALRTEIYPKCQTLEKRRMGWKERRKDSTLSYVRVSYLSHPASPRRVRSLSKPSSQKRHTGSLGAFGSHVYIDGMLSRTIAGFSSLSRDPELA